AAKNRGGLRSDRHADAEFSRASADREREHARDTDDRDRQGHGGKSPDNEGIQPAWREDFRADVLERGSTLDRLIGRQLAYGPRDCWYQRVRVRGRIDEQPPAAQFLLERLIDGHLMQGRHALVFHIRNDADDAAGFGADADKTRAAICPAELPVEGILPREELLSECGADNHDALGAVAIGLGEL